MREEAHGVAAEKEALLLALSRTLSGSSEVLRALELRAGGDPDAPLAGAGERAEVAAHLSGLAEARAEAALR